MTFAINAQEAYWTNSYGAVEPTNVDIIYTLMDDYFKTNKTQGVTVGLYENHSIGFSGAMEALGNIYIPMMVVLHGSCFWCN